MEFSLLWAALTGVGLMWAMVRLERRMGLLPDSRSDWFDVLLGSAISGVVVGRLAAMILNGTNPLTHPTDIILVRGGVDTGFASLAALSFLLWATRRSFPAAIDALAPAALAGLAGWHSGCVFRGTCLGTRSELPWALAEPGSNLTRHPTEIYAALLLAGAAAGAVVLLRRRPRAGLVAGAALAAAGFARLVTQPMRPSLGTGPVWWYVAAVALGVGVVGTSLLRHDPTA